MKSKIHKYQNKLLATSKTKILILAITFLMSMKVSAQGMPVYDNTNFISLAKSLIESAKQTSQLLKTVDYLKKQKENIERVTGAIQQLHAVQEIIQNNQRLYILVQNDLSDILNSPYIKVDEIDAITESFTSLLDNSLDNMDFISGILSDDNLKMTDSERAEILKEKERESKIMVSQIKTKTKRYRDIISFRKMQDRVNNRETNY